MYTSVNIRYHPQLLLLLISLRQVLSLNLVLIVLDWVIARPRDPSVSTFPMLGLQGA